MQKPLVIYHANCADGFGAAFAAWMKFGDSAEYMPMKYGEFDTLFEGVSPGDSLFDDRDVHILDFSFSKSEMLLIMGHATTVVWLDHHKTAFEMWCGHYEKGMVSQALQAETNAACEILLDDNKSGALIAWEYFHPDTPVPMLIRHIDDYDRWQFKINGTKEFNKALWSYAPWNFELWEELNNQLNNWDDTVSPHFIFNEGTALLRGHNQSVQSLIPDAIVCEIPLRPEVNARGLAVNSPHFFASDLGHELANRSGTYGLVWQMGKDGMVKCSLRSNGSYDVSAIAQEFGGGGHRNAAGCRITMGQLQSWLKP